MLDQEIKNELLSIIDKLAELDRKKLEIQKRAFEFTERISVIKSQIILDIALKRDNKDKTLYTTENIREAALIVALDNSEEYKKKKSELQVIRDSIQEIIIESTRLSYKRSLLMFEAGLGNIPIQDKSEVS
jgi:hypothetical protein